jgi:hypothetical protein
MCEDQTKRQLILSAFRRALAAWVCNENEQALTAWLTRELDSQGALIRLAISDWHACLRDLLGVKRSCARWPAHWDGPITRLVRASLRFARPDGSPATEFEQAQPNSGGDGILKKWVDACGLPVWEAAPGGTPAPTEDGAGQNHRAWGGSRRVLAALRADGPAASEFLVLDHRDGGAPCRLELFGAGRSWLGPAWTMDGQAAATTSPKPRIRVSDSAVEFAEWSYGAAELRVTQSALLLAGHRLALLSVLVESRSPLRSALSVRISLPPAVVATPIPARRAVVLSEPNKSGSVQVLPVGLPSLPYVTERGDFGAVDRTLVLTQAPTGRRCWLPLLVSWDSPRNRKSVHWRVLTVSERSRNVRVDRAVAARVSWGRGRSYVIYRSLTPRAARAFLGHQTQARFLVGRFTADGTVEPILKV